MRTCGAGPPRFVRGAAATTQACQPLDAYLPGCAVAHREDTTAFETESSAGRGQDRVQRDRYGDSKSGLWERLTGGRRQACQENEKTRTREAIENLQFIQLISIFFCPANGARQP